ncbi:PTS sugar transporter subunit IIA [Planctomycetota bacterium]
MLLTQIVRPACIKVPLQAADKESAILELVDLLDTNGQLPDKQAALDAVLTREKTRSTGIGSGIAIPHGKCKEVKELVMAIGITEEPIDFASVDSKPVKIIILLVSPTDQTGPHIQALASISKLMLDDKFKQSIEQATSADELYELMSKKENEQNPPS